MPLIWLSTNVGFDSEDAKRAFTADFSKFCTKTIGKDEALFNVDVSFNPHLMYGGTFEPAIMLKILSLYNVNPTNTEIWSREFSAYFESKLGVPKDRGLMAFQDPGPACLGMWGSTVEALRVQYGK